MEGKKHTLSSFSLLLIMSALFMIGAAMIPMLSVQYTPTAQPTNISVSFSWNDAAPLLVEQEVTSKIESVLARMDGVRNISSTSRKGGGSVNVSFKKGTKMDAARFEVASLIRYLYPSLPEGVSYPSLSLAVSGKQEKPILSYTINSRLTSQQIGDYLEDNMLMPLSRVDGVSGVNYSGIKPFEYIVTFDPERARVYDIRTSDISAAFNDNMREGAIGLVEDSDGNNTLLKLSSTKRIAFEEIPVKNVNGRLVRLGDIATVKYAEVLPSSYYRINGLNTINLNIYAEPNSNVVSVAHAVKDEMERLEADFPADFSALMSYDASEYIEQELTRILYRTLFTLLILLAFVYAVSRSFRYLLVIFSTLLANLLIAVIFYNLFDIPIHIYSLAGITVSMGLIIDTSIIMVDHYGFYKNRKVFVSILGALLTTIASLSIIFFLPESQKAKLIDFVLVLIINLSVSLVISYFFIPSLLDKLSVNRSISRSGVRKRRRVVKFERIYGKYIMWGRRRKWLFVVVLILGFGIPVHLLPKKLEIKKDKPKALKEFYNKTIGGEFYQTHKEKFEIALGGIYRVFEKSTKRSNMYREPERKSLTVNAGMPEGCTVHQLNDIVRYMENYIAQFDEIDLFVTNVRSYNNANINITFKPEYENTAFPVRLKQNIIQRAQHYGGATWGVYGIDDDSFNNNVRSGYKSNRIYISGYNYDQLMIYAESLVERLLRNPRVKEPAIFGGNVSWSVRQDEYFVQLDRERIAQSNINSSAYFSYIGQLLHKSTLNSLFLNGKSERVSLISSARETFDLWNVMNNPVTIDTVEVRLPMIGAIEMRPSGTNISKNNQSYRVTVAFDFVGSYELVNKLMKETVKSMNSEMPLGYKASVPNSGGGGGGGKSKFGLIMTIIAMIYMICAMIFESLRLPLLIVLMIPISFVGLFMVFAFGWSYFDQGGFAAIVMLSGLTVNAGIYIISEYENIRKSSKYSPLKTYLKAYDRKVIPIMLTIVSTVLGLIPFLSKGDEEVFWHAFASGVMGGMVFSIIALVLILPVFFPLGIKRVKHEKLKAA